MAMMSYLRNVLFGCATLLESVVLRRTKGFYTFYYEIRVVEE